MLGTAMITILFTGAYLLVSLLCPRGVPTHSVDKAEPVGRHAVEPSLEQEWFELFIDAWIKGEEQWVKYAWIQPWEDTVSWL